MGLKGFVLVFLFYTSYVYSLTVDEILDKMKANNTPVTSRIVMQQIIYQPSGRKNISKLVSYSADSGKKALIEYIVPKRIKGMKILQLNDGKDIWFYSRRTDRARKIASNQRKKSVNGSDFSYEDLSIKDIREDYNAKLVKEDENYYVIEFTPKKNVDVSYGRIVSWIRKDNFVGEKMEFYDENNNLWKRLTMSNIKKVGKYYTAEKIVMENLLKGSKTEMITLEEKYDIKLDDNLFSLRGLKQ